MWFTWTNRCERKCRTHTLRRIANTYVRTYRHAHTHTCARTSQQSDQRRANFMRYSALPFHSHIHTVAHTNRVFSSLFFSASFVRSFVWFHLSIQTSLSPYTQYAYIHITIFWAALIFNFCWNSFCKIKKFFFCCVLGDRYYCSSGSISKKNNQWFGKSEREKVVCKNQSTEFCAGPTW